MEANFSGDMQASANHRLDGLSRPTKAMAEGLKLGLDGTSVSDSWRGRGVAFSGIHARSHRKTQPWPEAVCPVPGLVMSLFLCAVVPGAVNLQL